MFNNLTIRARLIAVLTMLSLLLLAVGGAGLASLGQTHTTMRTVYHERLLALGHLDSIMRIILRNQLSIVRAAHSAPENLPAVVEQVEQDRDDASKLWQEYSESFIIEEKEKEMAERFDAARKHFMLDALAPALVAAKAGDVDAMRAMVNGPLEHMFPKLRLEMAKLIDYQLERSKEQYLAAEAKYARQHLLVVSLLAAGLVLAIGVGAWLVRSITRPLNRAVAVAQAVAKGDLTQRIEATANDETGQLLAALKEMNSSLCGMVGNVRQATESLQAASAHIADDDLDLSRRIAKQASALEETALSMEELTCTVRRNADNARQVNMLAQGAANLATRGGAAVFQAVEKMDAISASSRRMADIIRVIDGIATQTDCLARDASAEAQRAGGASPQGCAMVASEVRGLAQRTAAAAQEIRQLIDHSMEQVDAGNTLVHQAGNTMGEVVQAVHRVSGIINEITAASHEQSVGISQVSEAMLQMDSATQHNAALVEQAAAAAASMQQQACALAKTVGVFRLPAPGSELMPAANKPHSHQFSLASPKPYC
jgi:methyl-accepting chemotaxis protein-1 (serine sensor receptor)